MSGPRFLLVAVPGAVRTVGGAMNKDKAASSSRIPRTIGAASATLDNLPGVGVARKLVDGALGTVGSVPLGTRRVAIYAGAGLLGLLGAIEWPIVAVVAGAVWLTQPRSEAPRPAKRVS